MRLLLDTQVALWWLIGAWELAIKYRLGRLPVSPASFPDQMTPGGAAILPIEG